MINFLNPIWKARLCAVGQVVKQGRTVGLVECDVNDDKEAWSVSKHGEADLKLTLFV
jgi:acyl-coenzyme A thioesterase PaaI-like protein